MGNVQRIFVAVLWQLKPAAVLACATKEPEDCDLPAILGYNLVRLPLDAGIGGIISELLVAISICSTGIVRHGNYL